MLDDGLVTTKVRISGRVRAKDSAREEQCGGDREYRDDTAHETSRRGCGVSEEAPPGALRPLRIVPVTSVLGQYQNSAANDGRPGAAG